MLCGQQPIYEKNKISGSDFDYPSFKNPQIRQFKCTLMLLNIPLKIFADF